MHLSDFHIEIAVLSDPISPQLLALRVQPGTTLAQALNQAEISMAGFSLAKAGTSAKLDDQLAPGDRIELLPPLQVTPEEARKLRLATKQKRGKK